MKFLLPGIFAVACAVTQVLASPLAQPEDQLVLAPVQVHAKPPAARPAASIDVTVDDRFLGFFAKAIVTVLTTRVSSLQLPDTRRQLSVPVLGTVDLTLSELKVACTVDANATAADAQFVAMPDGRLRLNAANILIQLDSKWKWKAGILASSGSLQAKLNNTRISAYVQFRDGVAHLDIDDSANVGQNFHLEVTQAAAECGATSLTISDSKLTWLYRWLQSTFLRDLTDTVTGIIKYELDNTVPTEINQAIRQLPTYRRIWRNAVLNFPVNRPPSTNGTGLTFNIGFEGRVGAWDGRLEKCPYARDAAPINRDLSGNGRMMNVYVDEPVFNCALWALHKEGFFEYRFVIDLVDTMNVQQQLVATDLTTAKSLSNTTPLLDVPRIELVLSLPPAYGPHMTLMQTGQVEVVLPSVSAQVLVFLNGTETQKSVTPPFSLTLALNTSFVFEPRLVNYSRPTPRDQIEVDWLLRHSSIDASVVDEVTSAQRQKMDATVVNALMEWAQTAPLRLATDALARLSQQAMAAVTQPAMFIQQQQQVSPIPIQLPFPLDSIRVDELALQIVAGAWTLQADFSVDGADDQ